ncbi:MAG: hypothetical protein Q9166_007064 [cf. Caloplaca sp. 2 TL-2023]
MSTTSLQSNNQLDLPEDWNRHPKQCKPSSHQAIENGFSNSYTHLPDDESHLPPADYGKAAWLFLVGCFWLEGLVWGTRTHTALVPVRLTGIIGFPYSYGVFERYYSNHELFSSESGIAAIGSTGMVEQSSRMTALKTPNQKHFDRV